MNGETYDLHTVQTLTTINVTVSETTHQTAATSENRVCAHCDVDVSYCALSKSVLFVVHEHTDEQIAVREMCVCWCVLN